MINCHKILGKVRNFAGWNSQVNWTSTDWEIMGFLSEIFLKFKQLPTTSVAPLASLIYEVRFQTLGIQRMEQSSVLVCQKHKRSCHRGLWCSISFKKYIVTSRINIQQCHSGRFCTKCGIWMPPQVYINLVSCRIYFCLLILPPKNYTYVSWESNSSSLSELSIRNADFFILFCQQAQITLLNLRCVRFMCLTLPPF